MKYIKVIIIFFAVLLTQYSTLLAFEYNRAINLAGKQRMLTQKMSKETLLVALEIDQEINIANLKKTRDLFDKTLKGLRDGDQELGLDETKKPTIRKQLQKVETLWEDFDAVITKIIENGTVSQSDINVIAKLNLPLLKEMNKAVKFYEAAAADGGINKALAKAINLAGRQRMLTQKMTKEFLLKAYGHDVEKNKQSLEETVALFDTTLTGLVEGNSDLGLPAPPTEELKQQLIKVKAMWADFRNNIEATPNPETKLKVASNNLPLLKEMNTAVGLYEDF